MGKIGQAIACLYWVGAMISFVYLSWQLIAESGWHAWLMFGFGLPALMASVWPLWFFIGPGY